MFVHIVHKYTERVTPNRNFNITMFNSTSNISKMVQDRAILTTSDWQEVVCMIYQMMPFSVTLDNP